MTELSKSEAIAYLKISERTLERWVKKYKIAVRYENTEHGRAPFFSLQELERVKQQREPTYRGAIIHEQPSSVVPVQQLPVQVFVDTEVWELSIKLTLNLDEAALFSGVARSRLLEAAKSGELNARKIGRGWRVRQEDLKDYINKCFKNN